MTSTTRITYECDLCGERLILEGRAFFPDSWRRAKISYSTVTCKDVFNATFEICEKCARTQGDHPRNVFQKMWQRLFKDKTQTG